MKPTIYLSGPMSGQPDFNRPLFHQVAQQLRALGHPVLNPARHPDGWHYDEYMNAAYADIAQCDLIVLLPGWAFSQGCKLELAQASHLGVQHIELEQFLAQNQHEVAA